MLLKTKNRAQQSDGSTKKNNPNLLQIINMQNIHAQFHYLSVAGGNLKFNLENQTFMMKKKYCFYFANLSLPSMSYAYRTQITS